MGFEQWQPNLFEYFDIPHKNWVFHFKFNLLFSVKEFPESLKDWNVHNPTSDPNNLRPIKT